MTNNGHCVVERCDVVDCDLPVSAAIGPYVDKPRIRLTQTLPE